MRIQFIIYLAMLLGFGGLALMPVTAMAQGGGSGASQLATATFAGGCFWCTESDFEKVEGVAEVISGYAGGHVADPSYEDVSGGTTGHLEAIQVRYDPRRVTYAQLLDWFWRHVDPHGRGRLLRGSGPAVHLGHLLRE